MLTLNECEDGSWAWEVFQSAYGVASGNEPTLERAVTEMIIAEYSLFATPLPEITKQAMRADPAKVAATYEHRWKEFVAPWPRKEAQIPTYGAACCNAYHGRAIELDEIISFGYSQAVIVTPDFRANLTYAAAEKLHHLLSHFLETYYQEGDDLYDEQ